MRRTILAVMSALAMLVGFASAASAVTGSWTATSGVGCSPGTAYLQAHYLYDNSSLRADGYAVSLSNAGYVRGVTVTEYQNGTVAGRRVITFTGTATSSSTTGISEGYLPYMPRPGFQNLSVDVSVATTTCNAHKTWVFTPIG